MVCRDGEVRVGGMEMPHQAAEVKVEGEAVLAEQVTKLSITPKFFNSPTLK